MILLLTENKVLQHLTGKNHGPGSLYPVSSIDASPVELSRRATELSVLGHAKARVVSPD